MWHSRDRSRKNHIWCVLENRHKFLFIYKTMRSRKGPLQPSLFSWWLTMSACLWNSCGRKIEWCSTDRRDFTAIGVSLFLACFCSSSSINSQRGLSPLILFPHGSHWEQVVLMWKNSNATSSGVCGQLIRYYILLLIEMIEN